MARINSKTLADFIKKVSVNGSMPDGILKFGPEGLILTLKDLTNTGATTGLLKKNNFTEYNEMNIPIKSMSMLLSILGTMNGMINLVKQDNVFRITSDTVDADIIMPDETYLQCNLEKFPILDHDGGFELDSSIFGSIKKTTQILGTGKIGIIAEVKNKVLYLKTGEENFDKITAKALADYKDVSGKYGGTFLEFISVISGKVIVAFNDNYPLLITSSDNDSMIKWMLSPIIDTEEETES